MLTAAANFANMFACWDPLHMREDCTMFRWMLFYFVIILGIVAFVAFVLDIPIPGFPHSTYHPYQSF
jgi:hypothetical protein